MILVNSTVIIDQSDNNMLVVVHRNIVNCVQIKTMTGFHLGGGGGGGGDRLFLTPHSKSVGGGGSYIQI